METCDLKLGTGHAIGDAKSVMRESVPWPVHAVSACIGQVQVKRSIRSPLQIGIIV